MRKQQEMFEEMSQIQEDDPEKFKELMLSGMEMIKCWENGNIEKFHELITAIPFDQRKFVFWHGS